MSSYSVSLKVAGSGEKSSITANLRELAELVNRNSKFVSLDAQGSDGSLANVGLIESATIDLGIADPYIARDAFEGRGDFSGKPHASLRHCVTLGLGVQILYTLEESTIKALQDLRGTRILMQGGTATNSIGRLILQVSGIDPDRDAYLERMPSGDPVKVLREGKFDAAFLFSFVPLDPNSFLRNEPDLKFIALDENVVERMSTKFGGFYMAYTIEGSMLRIDKNIFTLALPITLFASSAVSKEAIYEILEIMYGHAHELKGGFKGVTPDDGLLGRSVPLHPGAVTYFKDRGAPLD